MERPLPSENRRRFLRGGLALAGLGLLSACGIVPRGAATPPKIPRIGWLQSTTPTARNESALLAAFRDGLRELGQVEGQTFVLEERYAEGRLERLPELAADLARIPVDIIVSAAGNPGVRAARDATSTIPIVMGQSGVDPVALGLIESLARPGGNVTGLTALSAELSKKRLELLKELLPTMSRVGVLWNAGAVPDKALEFAQLPEALRRLGLELISFDVRGPDDLEGAFAAGLGQRAEALLILWDGLVSTQVPRIVDLAERGRLPTISEFREFTDAGGLMVYGPNRAEMFRRSAAYVDRILKGAKPAELPVQQPTTYDVIVNLATARVLGLTVPQFILQQATEVIQ